MPGVGSGDLVHKCFQGNSDLHLLLSSEAELEPLKEQLRGAQELAASSQQKAALLGEELASAAGARDRTIAELHRSRLEVAEVTGRLAELSLHLKEEKCQWNKERAGLLQSVEVEGQGNLAVSWLLPPPLWGFLHMGRPSGGTLEYRGMRRGLEEGGDALCFLGLIQHQGIPVPITIAPSLVTFLGIETSLS